MSDESRSLAIGAIQQRVARKVDPEQLQLMGKQAAALYTKTGKPLSASVVEIAKHAALSPEQIRRVCEFANTAAYLEAFEKSGEVRNVTFNDGPADPSVVMKDLNDGSVPAVHQLQSADYDRSSRSYKTAGANDMVLAEAFLIPQGLEKSAGTGSISPLDRANPVDELYDLHVRLTDIRDQYMSKLSSCDVLMDEVGRDFGQAVKQELMAGSSMDEIQYAWSHFGSPAMIKRAYKEVADRLKGQEEVLAYFTSRSKTASMKRVPNDSHPVIERFMAFSKVAAQREKLGHIVDVLNEQISEVTPTLRRTLNELRNS